jgi:hypothetical protein
VPTWSASISRSFLEQGAFHHPRDPTRPTARPPWFSRHVRGPRSRRDAHDVNPRAYLHLVTKLSVHGWPQSKLRDLLPDRIVVEHPELVVGEHDNLATVAAAPLLHPP